MSSFGEATDRMNRLHPPAVVEVHLVLQKPSEIMQKGQP